MNLRSVLLALPLLLLLAGASVSAPAPGKIPLDYPVVPTTAKAGDWVLTPPRLWLDQAFEKGVQSQTFIFYAATMVKPGAAESTVKDLMGKEFAMPNSLIVPIRKGQKAAVGDIVLTWWQSGSGMQKSLVIQGGTPTQPKVLHLDLSYENPAGVGKKPDTLKPDTFHRLGKALEPGTMVTFKDGSFWKAGQVLNRTSAQVLYLGFAGRIGVVPAKACHALPVRPQGLKAGGQVMARSSLGSLQPARIAKIDPAIGRVFVTFPKAGDPKKVLAVAFGDLISKLP